MNIKVMKRFTKVLENITELESKVKFNKSRIFKRARYLYSQGWSNEFGYINSWSEALRLSWAESKRFVSKKREELKYEKQKLTNSHTPKRYVETFDYSLKSMEQAFNRGTNLNK